MKLRTIAKDELAASMPDICKQPYLVAHLLAKKNNQTLASLSLYNNPYIRHNGEEVLLFGNLQFSESIAEANNALLQEAGIRAQQMGKKCLLGPMNGSTWQDYRLPLEGDQPMFWGDIFAPQSWSQMLYDAGFICAASYHSAAGKLHHMNQTGIPAGVTIRIMSPETFEKDITLLYPLIGCAFSNNLYYSPVSETDFYRQYHAAKPLMDAGLSCIAISENKAVAFALAYPDLTDETKQAIIFKTIARHPDTNISGLVPAVRNTVFSAAWRNGFQRVIHAFMQDSNRSVMHSREVGGTVIRRYALFAKKLEG